MSALGALGRPGPPGSATGAARWSLPTRPWPVLAAALVVATAWMALAAIGGEGHAGMHHGAGSSAMDGMQGMRHDHASAAQPFAVALALWALMTVAMMGPAALPALRHVAVNTLRWRRGRAVSLFAAVVLALWTVFGAAVLLARPLWEDARPSVALAAGLALAAAWQLTALKRRALGDCHRTSPLPPRGRRADAGVVRFGLLNGGACMRSCWPLMLVMALAPSAPLLWMAGLTVVVTAEKSTRRPRRATRAVAALLGVAAGVALLVG